MNHKHQAPSWFEQALAMPFESSWIEVEGCPIHYISWGEAERPGLLFIHGGYAHAHWWRFIAPFFAPHFRCAALDLSGHGESGWRANYSTAHWLREIEAVAKAARFKGKPVLVGHSMGGLLTAGAALQFGEQLSGAIIDDAPIHNPFKKVEDEGNPINSRVYESEEEALARFRLLPRQPCANEFATKFLAKTSLHKVEGGWRWKFDPSLFTRLTVERNLGNLGQARCPLLFIRGERSQIVPVEMEIFVRLHFGDAIPVVCIPDAHHHVPLDQPLALVSVIRVTLSLWRFPGCQAPQPQP